MSEPQKKNSAARLSSDLSGVQRAAVLLMYLDHPVAKQMLEHLSTREIQEIGLAMAEVESIDPEIIEMVVGEFIRDMHSASMVKTTGRDYALGVFPQLVDDERRQRVESSIRRQVSKEFEEFVANRPARTVATILLDEHPQTVAIAMMLMGPGNAARIMAEIEEADQYEISMRMAHLKTVPGEIADDVERALKEALQDHGADRWEVEGVERTAKMLGRMPRTAQEPLMEKISDEDEALSDHLKRRMVVFTDLIGLDTRGAQALLKTIERQTLLIALRGADSAMKELLLSNMSKRASADIRDELEVMGAVPRIQVEMAQEEIVQSALKLQTEGSLQIIGGNADMI